jgi:hypothetical protein
MRDSYFHAVLPANFYPLFSSFLSASLPLFFPYSFLLTLLPSLPFSLPMSLSTSFPPCVPPLPLYLCPHLLPFFLPIPLSISRKLPTWTKKCRLSLKTYGLNHKVHVYIEYHSLCLLVRFGTPPPPLLQASMSPPGTIGEVPNCLRLRGGGSQFG